MDKKPRIIGITLAIAAIVAVFVTEQYFKPAYAVKSAVKLGCFAGTILAYSVISHRKLSDVINLHKLKNARALIVSALFCFIGIGIAFTLFKNQIDRAAIRQSLMSKERYVLAGSVWRLDIIRTVTGHRRCLFRTH